MNKFLLITKVVLVIAMLLGQYDIGLRAHAVSKIEDSVTKEEIQVRLASISSSVSLRYTHEVEQQIQAYTKKYRKGSEQLLGRVSLYFPLFDEILKEKGLPEELKYLPIIESSLKPTAKSRVGATGLWQFMKPTARQYKLMVNSTIDERRDPTKSTEAAANYLNDLYNRFGDWTLALAAYNCGGGNVSKAIRKAGSNDFWEIRKYLPKETRAYVPKFIAASYLMNYYHTHGLEPVNIDPNLRYTARAKVFDKVDFKDIVEKTGLNLETIKQLNPAFIRGFIPNNDGRHILTLPQNEMYTVMSTVNRMELIHDQRIFIDYHTNKNSTNSDHYDLAGNKVTIAKKPLLAKIKPLSLPTTEVIKLPEPIAYQRELKEKIYEYYKLKRNETVLDVINKRDDISLDEIMILNDFSEDNQPKPGAVIKLREI